jgi:hypothetical protein
MDKVNEKADQESPQSGKPPKDAQATRKEKAILALLTQPTVDKAAEAAGVHPATLYRWRKNPEFQRDMLAARREAFSQSIGRLQQASTAAVGTLLRIMADQQAPAGSRVQAAKCVLEQSSKGLEQEDLQLRVTQLELVNRRAHSNSESIRNA